MKMSKKEVIVKQDPAEAAHDVIATPELIATVKRISIFVLGVFLLVLISQNVFCQEKDVATEDLGVNEWKTVEPKFRKTLLKFQQSVVSFSTLEYEYEIWENDHNGGKRIKGTRHVLWDVKRGFFKTKEAIIIKESKEDKERSITFFEHSWDGKKSIRLSSNPILFTGSLKASDYATKLHWGAIISSFGETVEPLLRHLLPRLDFYDALLSAKKRDAVKVNSEGGNLLVSIGGRIFKIDASSGELLQYVLKTKTKTGKDIDFFNLEILKSQFNDGRQFPMDVRYKENFTGLPELSLHFIVKPESVKLDFDMSAYCFSVDLPDGAVVGDEIEKISYIAGGKIPDKDFGKTMEETLDSL